jgi:pyruvate,water dikinase
MGLFDGLFLSRKRYSAKVLKSIRAKFERFRAILEKNNEILRVISDMEEKSQGEYLFDINYINERLEEINRGLDKIIDELIELGGVGYTSLKEKYRQISSEIDAIVKGNLPIERDDYIVPFEKLTRDRSFSVGSKNAQLGEIRNRLGLPAPDGFAISAWGYKRFVEANDLQSRLSRKINSLNIRNYGDLEKVSREIREMIVASPIPEDLAAAITKGCDNLRRRSRGARFALRSSAIGEDTFFSFAGQYASFLNISCDEILDRYRAVIASKFAPQAIYYFLSHSLAENELAMSAGCMTMIDAASSGVIYTRDPVKPEDDAIIINAIFGLGKYLVDGTLTPDSYRLSRKDKSLISSSISRKAVRLELRDDGGVIEIPNRENAQNSPSLSEDQLRLLAEYAIKIEEHYQAPQDIEWAIDKENKAFILQTRPLQVVKSRPPVEIPGLDQIPILLKGGITVCPGAGAGKIFRAIASADLAAIPEGAILTAVNPFPGLITAMGKIKAIVTRVGNVASHLATIAREYRIPTLADVEEIDKLQTGMEATVDATNGIVYAGLHKNIEEARRPEYELFEDMAIFNILKRILTHISPLNLIGYKESGFAPELCQTYHDITRYAHQMAMVEMFHRTIQIQGKDALGLKLKSSIPLNIQIIFIDRDYAEFRGAKYINENKVGSAPFEAFWSGVQKEGWPSAPPTGDFKGFANVLATTMSKGEQQDYSEDSYAILSHDYMILSLRMGYHFSTIEAMTSQEISRNYIRMQFKEGGASLDRRIRRIRLLINILSAIGFECRARADFLDAVVSYQDQESLSRKLRLLGRMTILTKQLDMALSSDAVASWYTEDIKKKLEWEIKESAG